MKKIQEKFTKEKIIVILVCVVLILVYEVGIKMTPFRFIDAKEVDAVYILSNYPDCGDTTITDGNDIKEALKILKTVKGYRGPYSVDNLSGNTPDAEVSVHFAEKNAGSYTISFHGDFLVTDEGKFYKINDSEYDKLYKIVKKYEKNNDSSME